MLNNNQRTNIIVVTYHAGSCQPMLEKEMQCVNENIGNNKLPFVLTVWDNSLQNDNLSEVWNHLIHNSPTDCIVLLNSDAYVTEDSWLAKMRETLYSAPDIAAVGPSTNGAENQQKCEFWDLDQTPREIDFGLAYPGWQMEGFCLMISKERFLKIGDFNPAYTFYGQETAWLKKAQQAGYRTIWRKDAWVAHDGKATSTLAEKDGFNIKANLDEAGKLYRNNVL